MNWGNWRVLAPLLRLHRSTFPLVHYSYHENWNRAPESNRIPWICNPVPHHLARATNWQGRDGSNARHLVLETSTLPTELRPFDDTHRARQLAAAKVLCARLVIMIPAATIRAAQIAIIRRSAPRLRTMAGRMEVRTAIGATHVGSWGGHRTPDNPLNRRALYQLSYPGTTWCGRQDSNLRQRLGRPLHCHCATSAI